MRRIDKCCCFSIPKLLPGFAGLLCSLGFYRALQGCFAAWTRQSDGPLARKTEHQFAAQLDVSRGESLIVPSWTSRGFGLAEAARLQKVLGSTRGGSLGDHISSSFAHSDGDPVFYVRCGLLDVANAINNHFGLNVYWDCAVGRKADNVAYPINSSTPRFKVSSTP